jgi:two-component system, OmpR family, sensor histidine kinase KdpD
MEGAISATAKDASRRDGFPLTASERLRKRGFLLVRFVFSLAVVAGVTLICYRWIPANATTAGFAFLVAVLLIATAWGLWEAILASVAAMLLFNYYFLPPIGTLTISDPQNWMALFAFLITAATASQLSTLARRRTEEALRQKREMERLYALSRSILLSVSGCEGGREIARQIARTFELPAVILFEPATGIFHRAGPADLPGVEEKLRQAALQGTQFTESVDELVVTAIRLGGKPIGSLALVRAGLSDSALQALVNLVAIQLEQSRNRETASSAEAARLSEHLKSTLLDAIAHELKTPLTGMKAAASALRGESVIDQKARQELLTVLDEEIDRLNQLVSEAIQTARLEAGDLRLSQQRHTVEDLVTPVLREFQAAAGMHPLRVDAPAKLPAVFADAELVRLALRQLVDNAMRYAPANTPVTVSAHSRGSMMIVTVSDQGPGIPDEDQERIFDKFVRLNHTPGQPAGTGMGLAIAREIMRSHGGDVTVRSRVGAGAEFSLAIPLSLPPNAFPGSGDES